MEGSTIIFCLALLWLLCDAAYEGFQWLKLQRDIRRQEIERRGFQVIEKKH